MRKIQLPLRTTNNGIKWLRSLSPKEDGKTVDPEEEKEEEEEERGGRRGREEGVVTRRR